MTPNEFREAVFALVGEKPEERKYDEERAHLDADKLCWKLLEEIGYGAGVALLRRAGVWYA